MAVTSQWQSASDEDWALALARAAVIRPLTDQAELTEGLVATASAELGISRSLVYRLVAKFRKRPQVSSLLPGKRRRKAAARALSEAAEAVVREAIASVYLQREKPRLSDLLKEIQRQCQRKGLSVPNFRTVKRRVDAIDAKEHVRKRSGAKAARDRFRPTRVMSTADLLPLERVQIDHTRIDVVVVKRRRSAADRPPVVNACHRRSKSRCPRLFRIARGSICGLGGSDGCARGSAKRSVACRSTIRGALADVGSARAPATRQCTGIPFAGVGSWRAGIWDPDRLSAARHAALRRAH